MSAQRADGFSSEERDLLWQLALSTSLVSALCSCYVIGSYIYFKKIRSFSRKLVLMIAINDLGQAVSTLLGPQGRGDPHSLGCQFQAFTQGYFGLTSMLWSSSTAYTMHRVILDQSVPYGDVVHGPYFKYFFIVCQLLPLTMAVIPLIMGNYGPTGAWCWVNPTPSTTNDSIRLLCFYLWIWVGVVYCWYIYLKMEKALRILDQANTMESFTSGLGRTSSSSQQESVCWDYLKYYPLALVCAMFFASVNRVYQCFGDPVLWLSALQVTTESLQGAFDTIPFALTPKVRREFSRFFASKDDGDPFNPIIHFDYDDETSHRRSSHIVNKDRGESKGFDAFCGNEDNDTRDERQDFSESNTGTRDISNIAG